LFKNRVNKGRLAMVDMGDNGDVSDTQRLWSSWNLKNNIICGPLSGCRHLGRTRIVRTEAVSGGEGTAAGYDRTYETFQEGK